MNEELFWNELTDSNKDKVIEFLEGYAGSDEIIGRIFELYEEGALEAEISVEEYVKQINPNEYVCCCYDDFLEVEYMDNMDF